MEIARTNKNGVLFVAKSIANKRKYVVQCPDCGETAEMWSNHYYRGSNPCKCKNLKNAHPRLYSIWTNMKSRCSNPNARSYEHYGERGISVCNEWQDFKPFLEWSLANGYRDNLTIDRIDVNGNYEPANCRWADIILQANNKRNNINVFVGGKVLSLKRFCETYGLNYKTEHTNLVRHGIEAETYRLMDKLMELEEASHD